jgi:hypothetical protein
MPKRRKFDNFIAFPPKAFFRQVMTLVTDRRELEFRLGAIFPAVTALCKRSTGLRRALLAEGLDADAHEAIRAGERTDRPLGSARFLAGLEKRLVSAPAK